MGLDSGLMLLQHFLCLWNFGIRSLCWKKITHNYYRQHKIETVTDHVHYKKMYLQGGVQFRVRNSFAEQDQ